MKKEGAIFFYNVKVIISMIVYREY